MVTVLLSAGLTYALITTRQDLARTMRTLGATRTDLRDTQDRLTVARATLTSTEKKLSDTKSQLTAARDQIRTVTSQLADARSDAEQQRTRGDNAVQAAADLRECLDNVLVNVNAMQDGDYSGMTWNDTMYAQCQRAIAEGDAMADGASTTTV